MVVSFLELLTMKYVLFLKAHYIILYNDRHVFIILLSLQCFVLTISPLHPNHHIDHQGCAGQYFLPRGGAGQKTNFSGLGRGKNP